MAYVDDQVILDLMTGLAAAMEVEIEDASLPPFCFTGLVPGQLVPLDFCSPCDSGGCGMAWVRLAGIREVEDANIGRRSHCPHQFEVDIEMGMTRCFPTMEDDGEPATEEVQFEAARLAIAQQRVMRRAIACSNLGDVFLGLYVPIGPSGDCIGGAWSATFEV